MFAHYYLHRAQKVFDLSIDKLQPRKRATFLQICEYNILYNQ